MKYIRRYYDASTAIDDELVVSPNVSAIEIEDKVLNLDLGDDVELKITKKYKNKHIIIRKKYDYLTFTCIAAGGIALANYGTNASSTKPNIEYSKNGGEWTLWEGTSTFTNIPLAVGDVVKMRGINPNGISYSTSNYSSFTMSGSINASGNIMSLIDGKRDGIMEIPENSEMCFGRLFKNCASLKTCCELPAEKLHGACYFSLFLGTGITDASELELPAMEMTYSPAGSANPTNDIGCYMLMFCECYYLIAGPKLNSLYLANRSYYCIFSNCSSLVTAPALPATNLTPSCYYYMFQNCTSLTTAPELPATTLASGCYQGMFYNCSSLVTAPELPAITLTNNCYYAMFKNCAGLVNASELPATTLANNCYYSMFYNCTSLVNGPSELPASVLPDGYIKEGLHFGCYAFMFAECSKLVNAPIILAITVGKYSCSNMFQDCVNLVNAPELQATTLANYCYHGMFADCTSLVNAPKLPATALTEGCYEYMFKGCTSLTTAPLIAGKIHKSLSYDNMFDGCTKLSYVKCLLENPDDMPSNSNWLRGVSATGTFVKKSSVVWSKTGASGIPTGWTVEEADE